MMARHFLTPRGVSAPATGIHSRSYAILNLDSSYDDVAGREMLDALSAGGPLDAPEFLPTGQTYIAHRGCNYWGEVVYPLGCNQRHVFREF